MTSLYSAPIPTERDHIAKALYNLYKAEGQEGLQEVLGPAMTKHIKELITLKNTGPKSAIEIALKLYDFV